MEKTHTHLPNEIQNKMIASPQMHLTKITRHASLDRPVSLTRGLHLLADDRIQGKVWHIDY